VPNPGKDHIFLKPEKFSDTKQYDYPGKLSPKPPVPLQNRASHTAELREYVRIITKEMAAAIALQEDSKSILDRGLIVEFESFEGIGEAFEEKSFGGDSELLNIRYADKKTYATVFIPDGSLQKFENKVSAYYEERKLSNSRAADNQPLIDTIANFRKATVKALWTDTISMPENGDEIYCWEVWLTTRGDRQNQLNGFKTLAKALDIEITDNFFEFKERTVLLMRATTKQLEKSLHLLNNIAELRKAKTLADFFTEMKGKEQKEWLSDLQKRIVFPKETDKTPFICILDTGVNAAHPLLEKSLGVNDLHTINEAWGKADIVGHGTGIAGLALYGDLTEVLETKEQLEVKHMLESSKIINTSEYVPDDTKRPLDLYADFTKQGVAQAEITSANRNRIFQMAITTIDSRDKGKPSSWSAALDMLAAGMDNEGNKRLFVIAAGNFNINDKHNGKYPVSNLSTGIRDPGQAWNALTVGAYTEKDLLSDDENVDGSKPTALHGEISPYTTTSFDWETDWPLKPDIVMEGGNTAENQYGKVQADSLSLLTTNHKFLEKPFTAMWATSAASALASKMCAQIMDKYPALRPETVRALIVHSASWTPAMLRQFNCDKPRNNKDEYINLVRICGFGVPNLARAMTSMQNDFTMIIEDSLQPYKIENNTRRNNEIKFYSLPFPQKELLELGGTEIEMRITLSYFIEPNPSSRGRTHHSYKSHGLRFDVKNPSELESHFRGRLTKAMQEEGVDYKNDTPPGKWWILGKNGRTKGAIHSDIWRGSAVDLAGCGNIAIFPVNGWWRDRQKDKTAINNIAHYSLLVSIRTSVDVDLMSPVEFRIANAIKTDIEV
jgi:hypothetical protein